MRSLVLFVLIVSLVCGCIHTYRVIPNEDEFYKCDFCHQLTREVYVRHFKSNRNELLLCPVLRSEHICQNCYRILPHHLQEMYGQGDEFLEDYCHKWHMD